MPADLFAVLRPWLLLTAGIGLGYTVVLQLCTAAFAASAALSLARLRPSRREGRLAELRRSADPVPVTVVVPAYNEGPVIVHSVNALLALDYPSLEVIVVNDGSRDETLANLVEAYDLLPLHLPAEAFAALPGKPVRAVWVPRGGRLPLRVVDKEAGGSKADAINVGMSLVETPLVFVGDADGMVESDALARAVAALRDHRGHALAVGGTILPANDCVIRGGRIVEPRVPRNFLAACQLLEYLRSFLLGRAGMGALASVTLVSGAFGVFHTQDVLAVGGYTVGHLGEDLDLTIRLARHAHDRGLPLRGGPVLQVPESVLWTQVPDTLATLRRQRIRWHRGLVRCMREHRSLIGNPRYRAFGLLGMTYLAAFEFLSPVMEAVGYVSLAVAAVAGVSDLPLIGALALVAVSSGWLVSGLAIYLQERRFGRYGGMGELLRLLLVALVEPLLYRPLTLVWRLRAMLTAGRGHWGEMPRKEFAAAQA